MLLRGVQWPCRCHMGANHAYPDVAAEVFVLEPLSEFEVPPEGKATAPEKPDEV